MESIAELQTRITELSSLIDAQAQVLRYLENNRSMAQRELNSRLDPMARLPLEISSEIFMRCTSTSPRPKPRAEPLTFLSISHLWRHVALSTPSLWSTLHIGSSPRGSKFVEFCTRWVERARTLPLSLSLRGSVDRRIQALVKQHAHRLQNLELYVRTAEHLQRIQGPFPSLKKLTIAPNNDQNGREPEFLNTHECVEILRAAPELLECCFENMYYMVGIHGTGPRVEPLTHTSLRHLRLGDPQACLDEDDRYNSAYILQYLTLPALESIHISDLDITIEEFVSFLTRSSASLQSLHLVVPTRGDWSSDIVIRYFRPIPGLTNLELLYIDDGEDAFVTFLEVLCAAQDFLPNLRSLTIRASFSEHMHYRTLISALTARRASRHASLQSFQLILELEHGDLAPDDETIEVLRQLVKDGMYIHVGSQDQNFI